MKTILSILFFFELSFTCFSQDSLFQECGTPNPDSTQAVSLPYFGNNAFIDAFLQEEGYFEWLNAISDTTVGKTKVNINQNLRAMYHIPIKVWQYHDSDGTNEAFSIDQIMRMVAQINRVYANNNTGIRFYIKCITQINSSEWNYIRSKAEFQALTNIHKDITALNWHVVRGLPGTFGIATFPFQGFNNYSFATNRPLQNQDDITGDLSMPRTINTACHEIGHTLGLFHTFQPGILALLPGNINTPACYQESVNRTRRNWIWNGCLNFNGFLKCEINGDFLCDTEAATDGNMGSFINLAGCNWFGGQFDSWGDGFMPQTNNLMSYSFDDCRTTFTQSQIGVMHTSLALFPNGGIISMPNWINLNHYELSGTVNAGDNDVIISPEFIEAPKTGNKYDILQGGKVMLIAGKSIELKAGVNIEYGANTEAVIGLVTCDDGHNNGRYSPQNVISSQKHNQLLSLIEKTQQENKEKLQKETLLQSSIQAGKQCFFYPQPFQDELHVRYELAKSDIVTLQIMDISGKVIQKMIDKEYQNEGLYEININNIDLPSGIFLYEFRYGECVETGRIMKIN